MKTILRLTLATIFLLGTANIYAQNKSNIPNATLKKLDGTSFNTSEISNDGKPIILNFWATWCSPCKAELNNIAEIYEDWQDETGVKIIAISIDDTRNMAKVAPYVNGKGWEYEVYLDPNSDFRRAMGVNNVPHSFLLDGNGNVVYQHTVYNPGDEFDLYEKVKKVAEGETLK